MPEDFPIMADLEKPAADTQQEENAVAMTEVGGNDPPVGPAIVGSLEDEAVASEQESQESLDQAATAEKATDDAMPEDAKQIEEVPFESEEAIVAQDDLVEQAAVMDGDLPGKVEDDNKSVTLVETETKPEATEQPIVDQEPDAVIPVEDKKEDVKADDIQEVKEDEKMDVTPEEQAKPAEENQKLDENLTQAADAEDAAGSGLDDLFGTDDEGEQTTRKQPAADDDSEIESITPSRPTTSAEESGQGARGEDEDEEGDAPLRKKQRRGSAGASDPENENHSRDVDGERNDREARRDEEEQQRLEDPDENDEAFGEAVGMMACSEPFLIQSCHDPSARKRALDARIEAIGKAGKRKRSRKKDDSEDLGLDRQIEEMTTMMDNAIREDVQSNKSGLPALKKTQILSRVISVLQNASLQQSILESNDFLSTLRRFIEPMEDGSLPSLTIQKGILFQLGRLEGLEVIHLRNSGLGKVVNFYTRCKRCQPEIIRQANLLIDRWSKPILDNGNNARASARARAEAERDDEEDRRAEGGERGEGASDGDNSRQNERKHHRTGELLRARVLANQAEKIEEQKGTRLPNVIGHAYAVAPQARRSAKLPAEQALEEARQRELERINRFKKKAMQASR